MHSHPKRPQLVFGAADYPVPLPKPEFVQVCAYLYTAVYTAQTIAAVSWRGALVPTGGIQLH